MTETNPQELDFHKFIQYTDNETGFSYGKIPDSQTMVDLIFVHDSKTDVTIYTPIGKSNLPFQSVLAFAGARYSRSNGIVSILEEIKNGQQDADKKLGNIVNNYGHASVAEMANLPIYIENLTKFQSERLFHLSSIYAGQGRSSRYQKWDNMEPIGLEKYLKADEYSSFSNSSEWQSLNQKFISLQETAKQNYLHFYEESYSFFKEHFEIDDTKLKQKNTLISRSLDMARYFLPIGAMHTTSMAMFTSAREWSRVIGLLSSKTDFEAVQIAKMLLVLLNPSDDVESALNYVPEASELIKYTTSDEVTGNNLNELNKFLENSSSFTQLLNEHKDLIEDTGSKKLYPEAKLLDSKLSSGAKLVLQNILSLHPSLDVESLSSWVLSLNKQEAAEIGQICFHNFNHHRQIGQPLSTNQVSLELTTDFGSMMDLNRHRAWGRFNPIFNYIKFDKNIIKKGYVLPLYLEEIETADKLKNNFNEKLEEYYSQLNSFWDECLTYPLFPTQALIDLLPIAQNANILMHASSKEIDYMTKLRVRPGGHINYRQIVYQIQQSVIQSDPFFKPESLIKPNPNSKEEFMDRS